MKTTFKMPVNDATNFARSVLRRIYKFAKYTEINMVTYNVVRDNLRYLVTSTKDGFQLELVLCGDFYDVPVISVSMSKEEYKNLMGNQSVSRLSKIALICINDPLVVMSLMEHLGH